MEIKDLKILIKLVTDTDITEFEMENAEEKIVIKRGKNSEIIQVAAPSPVYAPTAAPAPAPMPQATAVAPAVAAESGAAPLNPKHKTITSPIVGTFYRKPSPEAEVFCEVGSVMEAGKTVCLVEAMKMFNEIETEFKCKIIEILKDDAAPVEYGEALFVVEPL